MNIPLYAPAVMAAAVIARCALSTVFRDIVRGRRIGTVSARAVRGRTNIFHDCIHASVVLVLTHAGTGR